MGLFVNVSFFMVCFFLSAWLLYYITFFDRRIERRKNYYFHVESHNEILNQDTAEVEEESTLRKLNEVIREKLSSVNQSKIDKMLKSSGVNLNSEEYIMLQCVAVAIIAGILYFLTGNIYLLIPGGIIGYILPKVWIKRRIKLRIEKFNENLPDMIVTIIGSLRSGYSFVQSFKTVVEECDSPVKEEIGVLLKELNYGISMENALNNLKSRVPSNDLELMVQAVLIQRQVGGNLAGLLEIIVETIRERNRIQRQVQTLTAQGRLSGRVIGGLPIVLGFLLYLINPDYIKILFTNTIGIIIVVVGVISGIIGFILINELTKIEV